MIVFKALNGDALENIIAMLEKYTNHQEHLKNAIQNSVPDSKNINVLGYSIQYVTMYKIYNIVWQKVLCFNYQRVSKCKS